MANVIIHCVYKGKIISQKRMAEMRGKFPDQKLVDDAYRIAVAKTANGNTSYVYAHHNDNELEIQLNATEEKYPFE
jgi:hypothetical protein